MFFTYVLRSRKDKKLYVGYTPDLKERLKKHSNDEVQSTRSRLPMVLVYYEASLSKKKAIEREKYFKTGFGRRFLKSRI